jgi:hypothetical protein
MRRAELESEESEMSTSISRHIRLLVIVALAAAVPAATTFADEPPPAAATAPAPAETAPADAHGAGSGAPAVADPHAAAPHRYIGAVGIFGTLLFSTYPDHDFTTGAVSTKLKGLYGGGGFIKLYLDKKSYWAIEVAARAMSNSKDDSIYVPIDLLFQRVFKVNSHFKPFIGLGPSFVPVLKSDKITGKAKTAFEAGGALDLGAYWPIGKSGFSILTILHYNLLWDVTNFEAEADGDRFVHEFGASLGAAYTF